MRSIHQGSLDAHAGFSPDDPVHIFMNRYDPDHPHALQVMRLSCMLFDDLSSLHRLSADERYLLAVAAMLHDTGWSMPALAHHKASMQLILDDSTVPLSDHARTIVALTARYHRKAHPSGGQILFSQLFPKDQNIVRWNAAILRMADVLDRPHRSLVQSLSAEYSDRVLDIWCSTGGIMITESDAQKAVIRRKSALLAEVSGREVVVRWN